MSAPSTPTRFFALVQRALQAVLFFLQTRDAAVRLVAEFALGDLHLVGCRFRDALGELGGFAAPNAFARQGLLHPHAQHFAGGAELSPDHLGLANERVQHPVLLPLRIDEIAAGHDLGRLQFAVDAAVALFEARRVPGQVEMDEVMATGLKVQALAGRVRADENADGLLIEGRVEGDLDPVALLEARLSREDEDATVQVRAAPAALEKPLLQPLDEPTTRVVPFREQKEPAIPPAVRGVQHLSLDPVQDRLDARVSRVARRAADGQHSIHMGDGGVEIAKFRLRLAGRDLDEVVVLQQLRVEFDRLRLFVLALSQQCLPVGGQSPVERRDRGEKPLLKVGEQEARPGAAGRGLPVVVEHGGQAQFRGVRRQAIDLNGLDDAFGKGLAKPAEVFLEPADHDGLQLFGLDVDASGEALRIEDFEQRRERVGMTVVRRGGQRKAGVQKRRRSRARTA